MIQRAASEPVAIRRADADDLDGVLALERAGFDPASWWSAESWRGELTGADRCVLVADCRLSVSTPNSPLGSRQARPAGVATFQLAGEVADLHRVVVAADQRGRGVGRALVEAGLAWVAGRQGRRVLLEVEPGNASAMALYRRLGFAELGRRKDYYGAGRDALVMQYEITEMGS